MNRPLVYICSPLRGDYDNNIDNATSYSRAAFTRGYIPITPHIYFTRFMNDENEKERCMAMDAGLQLLRMCSEIWVFGLDDPSEGMQAEIAFAIRNGIKVRDGFEILSRKNKPERRDELDAKVYCLGALSKKAAHEQKTSPDGFVSLKDMFKHANVNLIQVRKEDGPCQSTAIMKAIRILPHGKQ